MSRPRKCRKVCHFPQTLSFAPTEQETKQPPVILTVDEYETVRLIDKEGLSQEQCSELMKVARTTVQQVYASARRKLADVIVDGLPLRIQGGDYTLCDGRGDTCCFDDCFKQRYHHRYARPKAAGTLRIAVPYDGGRIFQHFGHAAQVKLYDVQADRVTASEVLDTPAAVTAPWPRS